MSGKHARKTKSKYSWAQPRIPGVVRLPRHTCLHPLVKAGLQDLSDQEERSISYIIAEVISDYFGIDCRTGEIHRRDRLKRTG